MKQLGQAESDAERHVEALLAGVEDWAARGPRYAPALAGVISPIHRGTAAQAWLVALDGESPAFFMKVLHADMAADIDLPAAFAAARIAGIAKVAPMPRHLLADAIIFDLLPKEWDWARLHRLVEPALRTRLLAAKRVLHEGPSFGRARSLAERLRELGARVEAARVTLPPDGRWLLERAALIATTIESAGIDRKPCHLSGVASDVMIGPQDAIRLVDFDMAGDADPHWDLGTMMAELCQFEDEEMALVEEFNGRYDRRVHHRARLLGAADDVAGGLWAYLMGARSTRRSVEFVKYAEWRLLRARMVVHDHRFEAMLRHV